MDVIKQTLLPHVPSIGIVGWIAVLVLALIPLQMLRNWLRDPWRTLSLRKGEKLYPLISGWPIAGVVPYIVAKIGKGYPQYFAKEWTRKYGQTIRTKFWHHTVIFTTDPEVVQYLVSTGFRRGEFNKGPHMRNKYKPWLGDGIFTSDDEAWKMQRAFAKELFHSASMKHHVKVFHDTANVLADKLESLVAASEAGGGSSGAEIDMQDYYMRYTLDTFVKIGLGAEAGAIGEQDNKFQAAFDCVQVTLSRRDLYGALAPIVELFGNFPQQLSYMNKFSEAIINDLSKLPTEELSKNTDLLSRMLVLQREQVARGGARPDELDITPKFLTDTVMNFLVAGRDTTAVTLSFCTYLLAKHPDVEKRVLEEFAAVLGDGRDITMEKVRQCRYVKQVLQETLRLFPPVPGDGYQATKETVLPGGHRIPKGQRVYYLALTMHRDDRVYDNALKFDPDRWAPGNAVAKPPMFMSFHGGPRICLGQDMAYLEATVALFVILRRFKFATQVKGHLPLKAAVILTARDGMKLTVTRR